MQLTKTPYIEAAISPIAGLEIEDARMIRKKIMVVEDDRELRDVIKLALTIKLDARVVVATDGFMALMMARGEQPDLIVMDLSMPYVDGFKAIELLKADAATQDIPIMAFSNYTWDFDWKQKVVEMGCVRGLEKTKNMTALVRIVGDFLDIHN